MNEEPFHLKHYDDKGDHILVDDDYKITEIIESGFASAEAKELAFSSPCMMWPVGDYYDGLNNLSETIFAHIFESRGRNDISGIISNGWRWQRWLFLNGGGVEQDESTFQSLFQGLPKSFAVDGEQSVSSYTDWKARVIDQYTKEDPTCNGDCWRSSRRTEKSREIKCLCPCNFY